MTAKEMEKRIAELEAQNAGLLKRVEELQAAASVAKPSKSREQALAVQTILQKDGRITKEQLLKLNSKYPSDPIYYFKNILKGVVIRKDGIYFTPQALVKYEEEKAKAAPAAAAPGTGTTPAAQSAA